MKYYLWAYWFYAISLKFKFQDDNEIFQQHAKSAVFAH